MICLGKGTVSKVVKQLEADGYIQIERRRKDKPNPPYTMSNIPDDPREITPEQWEAMKAVDIRTVDKSQLVDLNTVQIDESLPVQERVLSYLKQVKNPYCVRVGNVAAKVTYKEDGPSFEEVFKHLLRQQSMM